MLIKVKVFLDSFLSVEIGQKRLKICMVFPLENMLRNLWSRGNTPGCVTCHTMSHHITNSSRETGFLKFQDRILGTYFRNRFLGTSCNSKIFLKYVPETLETGVLNFFSPDTCSWNFWIEFLNLFLKNVPETLGAVSEICSWNTFLKDVPRNLFLKYVPEIWSWNFWNRFLKSVSETLGISVPEPVPEISGNLFL